MDEHCTHLYFTGKLHESFIAKQTNIATVKDNLQ